MPALNEHTYALKRHDDHTYSKLKTDKDDRVLKPHNVLPSASMEVSLPGCSGSSRALQANVSLDDRVLKPHNVLPSASMELSLPGCSGSSTALQTNVSLDDGVLKPHNVLPDASVELSLPGCSGSSKALQSNVSSEPIRRVRKSATTRKRLIPKKSLLTPLSKTIYDEYKKATHQLDYYKRVQSAVKFCKKSKLEERIQCLNPIGKKIIDMQMRLCRQKKHGRRFTTEEKIVALSIMKQSPKCYRFLSTIFILPSKSTLNSMIAKLVIEPGISPQVFNLLKKEVEKWDPRKKICSIIFDEISLDTALVYNKNKDSISGFVELKEKKAEFADHALVFMLRGAVYKWQQPICYYFCKGATSAINIKNILRQLVPEILKLGLDPIAIICDQGAAFQSAINSFKEETKRKQIISKQNPDGTISICGHTLHVVYDPSHLIKGLRNNFLSKDIIFDGKIAKWQDIVDVYETDCQHTEMRLLHKLNDQCVIPKKIKKMKVRNCVRVLSQTMAAALSYTANFSNYADGRPVSSTIRNTSEVVGFLDEVFDSVNGASVSHQKVRGKNLRKAVTEKSLHHKFWPEAIKKLEKLNYVDKNGVVKSVPSLKNFITTLKSFMKLWQYFKEKNLKIMRPRYFNSDPIENFFGQVRAYNYRNNDPNCHNFSCTFKSLLITRLIKFHSDSFNCEDDSADQAVDLKSIIEKPCDDDQPNRPLLNNIENLIEQARRERMNTHSRAYTAGWVVGKILKNLDCRECRDSLTSSESLSIHNWIDQREYSKAQKRRLTYPSEGAVRSFGAIINVTNEYLENNAHQNELTKKIKNDIISKYSFEYITCAEHKEYLTENFIYVTVRFSILNWCNNINRILKGTDIIRLNRRTDLPKMQRKALENYNKKLKNKSFNK